MQTTAKALYNNNLAALSRQAAPGVLNAIKTASRRTGVDFAYLLEKAGAESSFNTKAKSKSSSATGLYQFIESTWMSMVKNYGHKYGMGAYADKIDAKGRVADPALRREILSLRKDPEKASFLAAEFAAENKRYLEQHLGPEAGIGSTELYLAHFLGAGSATAFLKGMKQNPMTAAADMFPKAARANRNVFYDSKTGEPRSLAGMYEFFDRKFQGGSHDAPARDVQSAATRAPRRMPAPSPMYDDIPAVREAREDIIRRQMAMDNAALEIFMARPEPASRQQGDEIAGRRQRQEEERGYQRRQAPLPPIRQAAIANPAEIMVMARLDMPRSRMVSHMLNN